MEKIEYKKHFELEENFWWFRGRRKILQSILRSRLKPGQSLRLLDAGCGAGYNLKFFASLGTAFGCDFSEDALYFCRLRGLKKLARADVQKLPFNNQSFDIVSLLDVISHESIQDDLSVLKEIGRLLKSGGYFLLADNALEILGGPHDAAYHVRERYRKRTLKKRLEAAGFTLVRGSYFNFLLFPGIFLIRLWENFRTPKTPVLESDLKAVNPKLNGILYSILRCEAFLSKYVNLPLGSSIVCLARKRS